MRRRRCSLTVRLDAACDFADLFEVKDALRKKGRYATKVERRKLTLEYQRASFVRATAITATRPAQFDAEGLTFTVRIPAHGEWSTGIDVVTERVRAGQAPLEAQDPDRARARMRRNLERWIDGAPRVECDWEPLKATYRRSLVDLAALRFSPPIAGGRSLPAAGLPWFMTMFGRDSIFTSLQALPFTPELAATTLRALGDWQGVRSDDFRDEDPGRILHEMRYGEMTAFEERPHSPYYGSVDATPLYLVLLDEYERWTGDRGLVRELEIEARAALRWIDEYADLQGTGYVWYQRRNEEIGLENQCWKDSWDSISFRDGTLPGFPRATCELQGYAYDAKVRGARLAREIWKDAELAEKLERDAADLKRRFNRDFWVEDGEYFALALDQDGRQVDALASNNGHLLWSGIVDKSKAKAVARHLLGPRLFSGWGVRTLAAGEARYNPIGYHTGTVWPFDNSFIAWGLRRYGFEQEAARDRGRHPRRGRVLRRSPARGVRRLPARPDEVPGPVPHRLQPAGVVDGDAAAPPADDARARAARCPPRGRAGSPARDRPPRAARHPGPLGPDGRLRSRPRRHATRPPLARRPSGRLPGCRGRRARHRCAE